MSESNDVSKRGRAGQLDVLLVGQRPPHGENLALGYLLAALRRAGYRASATPLNDWTDMDAVAEQAVRRKPHVVGLAIPDAAVATLMLGAGDHLRRRGYCGHVTAGGAFATLARSWLLERYEWLDSVVRLAGEIPLVELTAALRQGVEVSGAVAGLTTRQGDGRPAPMHDARPLEMAPARDVLPVILGYRVAHISTSRGCPGECAYCGPAALQQLERSEAARLDEGSARAAIGIGGLRRRPIESVADEMARLWHERQVRYFCFVDEQLLPDGELAALAHLRRWRHALAERSVERPAFSCMLRADRITDRVLDALCELGLARCLVGMELLSRQELARFARRGDPMATIGWLRQLESRGITTVCNVMLVHPYSSEQSIERGLAVLESMADLPYEATRMQVFHGTRLQAALEREGRLVGNPLWYEYALTDPVARRFASIDAGLEQQAPSHERLSSHLRDVRLALNLAQRIHADLPLADLASLVGRATRRANELHGWARRQALAFARRHDEASVRDLFLRVERLAARELAQLDELWNGLQRRVHWRGSLFSPAATAAASAVTYVLLSAGTLAAAACAPTTPAVSDGRDAHPLVDASPVPRPAAAQSAGPPLESAPPTTTAPGRADPGSPTSAEGAAAYGTEESRAWAEYPGKLWPSQETGLRFTKEPLPKCPSPQAAESAERKASEVLSRLAPCASPLVSLDTLRGRVNVMGTYTSADATDESSWEGRFERESDRPLVAPESLIDAARALATGLTREELGCIAQSQTMGIHREGGDAAQIRSVVARLDVACKPQPSQGQVTSITVHIDAAGSVVAVLPAAQGKVAPAELHCVRRALRGLRFPCLGDRELLLEHGRSRGIGLGDFF